MFNNKNIIKKKKKRTKSARENENKRAFPSISRVVIRHKTKESVITSSWTIVSAAFNSCAETASMYGNETSSETVSEDNPKVARSDEPSWSVGVGGI